MRHTLQLALVTGIVSISFAATDAPAPSTQPATTQPLFNMAEPAPATQPTTRPAAPVTVTIRAMIDGRSQLKLKGMTARWQHFDWAAPGVHGGHYEPTYIDGVAWHPNWDNSDMDPEVRIAKSMSDTFDGVDPPIPAVPMTVTLEKIKCREAMTIVQQPTTDNDYTTILEFNDNDHGGWDWYEAKLTFTPKE